MARGKEETIRLGLSKKLKNIGLSYKYIFFKTKKVCYILHQNG